MELNTFETDYRFIASDGIEHTVRYIADERGYRVLGESVPEPPPPAPAVSYIPVLAHSLPHVPYHKTPVTHPIQYIPVGVHTPTTNKVEYVKLAGSDLIYVFDGIKYVPVKGNKKSEGVHMHPNVVYSLIKWCVTLLIDIYWCYGNMARSACFFNLLLLT